MIKHIGRRSVAAGLAAALLALAGCEGGAEADRADTADTAGEDAAEAGEPAEKPAMKVAAAEPQEESGPPEFKETVKSARCKVYDPGGDYDGPCQFTTWGGGSFMVSRKGGEEFFGGITEVVVEIDAPGVAGGSVRQNGELNPIGTMERHTDDRACWSSADFTVCAN
jgi:hypothetical protein